ncbi:MAG: hypothetical protein JWL91_647 [Sphingomonas bacterium]|jgi:hypothetical protein|nr:hypothetical protein [Sphingomonas bacterium]MDB5688771.1 hypothetical protein [Sphingomonas bacterium]
MPHIVDAMWYCRYTFLPDHSALLHTTRHDPSAVDAEAAGKSKAKQLQVRDVDARLS